MNPHAMITRAEFGVRAKLTGQSLANMAKSGLGPQCYTRRGRGVQSLYRVADVETYLECRGRGLSHRDATLVTARAAWLFTCEAIEARFGASDPKFAEAQRRAAHLQLTQRCARLGVDAGTLDALVRNIECRAAGLPCPEPEAAA